MQVPTLPLNSNRESSFRETGSVLPDLLIFSREAGNLLFSCEMTGFLYVTNELSIFKTLFGINQNASMSWI